jgi:hypothetical protein
MDPDPGCTAKATRAYRLPVGHAAVVGQQSAERSEMVGGSRRVKPFAGISVLRETSGMPARL